MDLTEDSGQLPPDTHARHTRQELAEMERKLVHYAGILGKSCTVMESFGCDFVDIYGKDTWRVVDSGLGNITDRVLRYIAKRVQNANGGPLKLKGETHVETVSDPPDTSRQTPLKQGNLRQSPKRKKRP